MTNGPLVTSFKVDDARQFSHYKGGMMKQTDMEEKLELVEKPTGSGIVIPPFDDFVQLAADSEQK